MFHVEHFVDANMYVLRDLYNWSQMQPAKRIRRRGKMALLEAEAWCRPVKRQVSLRLDGDVLAWFQRDGRGYQTRINRALRKLMEKEGTGGARQDQVSKGARAGAPS
jgi:uncharacterized protein (DUF4415 family)